MKRLQRALSTAVLGNYSATAFERFSLHWAHLVFSYEALTKGAW